MVCQGRKASLYDRGGRRETKAVVRENRRVVAKKFAEMTGTIQKLDENTTAYVGTNGIAVMGKDGRQLSVDTSALSYDMLECLFDNLQRGGNYFDSSYWQNQLQKVF